MAEKRSLKMLLEKNNNRPIRREEATFGEYCNRPIRERDKTFGER
jgi:hypothetical protein